MKIHSSKPAKALVASALFLSALSACALEQKMTDPAPTYAGTSEDVSAFLGSLKDGDVVVVFDANKKLIAYDARTLRPLPKGKQPAITPGVPLKAIWQFLFVEGSCEGWPASTGGGVIGAPITFPPGFCP